MAESERFNNDLLTFETLQESNESVGKFVVFEKPPRISVTTDGVVFQETGFIKKKGCGERKIYAQVEDKNFKLCKQDLR
jgi:hypothetical protein